MKNMLRLGVLTVWAVTSACATTNTGASGFAGLASTQQGWRHLVAGDASRARASFAEGKSFDAFAVFGSAFVAYEHGETERALADVSRLLSAAGSPGAEPWTQWLATAGTSWLSTLLYESPAWREQVDVLSSQLLLPLPWQARIEMLQAADDTARRAGRADALARLAQIAACPSQASLTGSAGLRPMLDLLSPPRGFPSAPAVLISGCRAQVPPQASMPGVLVVKSKLTVAQEGPHDVVLEYRGIAAVKIDGGSWHTHGSVDTWGPHRSSVRVPLTPGVHDVELRLSTFGGGADYWLAAFAAPKEILDAPPLALRDTPKDLAAPLTALSHVLVARLVGQWNEGLSQAKTLVAMRSFALGLVEAGRMLEAEPTRPDNLTRDAARTVWRLAVEQDPGLVRARLALSALENIEGRPREATAMAMAAMDAAPRWWPAALAAHEALTTEGLEAQADKALDAAWTQVQQHEGRPWACPVIEAMLRRVRQREQLALVDGLLQKQHDCEARDTGLAARFVERGQPDPAARAYESAAQFSSSPQWLAPDLATTWAAQGQTTRAVALLQAQSERWPREPSFLLRLANLHAQNKNEPAATATLQRAVRAFPAAAEVRQAALAAKVALPMEAERLPGLLAIDAFMKSGHTYDAPAVFVLDRLVERIFPDGGRALLTHSIVRVQSKDALDRWGEVNVPAGAEVLTLRTVKPDLTVREPEDIFGKETVSAPELEPGDFIEWETLEFVEPSAAFGTGFVSPRFYFQSNEAPLERSEYIVVSPKGWKLDFDVRAGAPAAIMQTQTSELVRYQYVATRVPQVFPERASVPALYWIPSVRLCSGVNLRAWAGFVDDRLSTMARSNPDLVKAAQTVLAAAGGERATPWQRAEALVHWVTESIEAEGGADEPASFAVARGRGNRLAVAQALSKLLQVNAEVVIARPLTTADAHEVTSPQETMVYSEALLRFVGLNSNAAPTGSDVYVDLRLRDAPFGYVPAALDGASAVRLADGAALMVRSLVQDVRKVMLDVAVDAQGDAVITAKEHLVGAVAIDWKEALRQLGAEEDKRQRRFEEAYLAYHFPGATLEALTFAPTDRAMDLEYRIKVERLATTSNGGLVMEPRFFLSQPGRRYATEPTRKTTLLMTPEAPLDLVATLHFAASARIAQAGANLDVYPLGSAGPHFVEQRAVKNNTTVVLRRQVQMPTARVTTAQYAAVGATLRKVDLAEQAAIHVDLRKGASVP